MGNRITVGYQPVMSNSKRRQIASEAPMERLLQYLLHLIPFAYLTQHLLEWHLGLSVYVLKLLFHNLLSVLTLFLN